MKRANGAFPSANLLHDGGQMSKSISDELLQEFSRGFAFEKSPRQQLNFEQMIALADMLIGWALDERTDPKRSAWLTGVAEGLLAEADLLGPDWNPPEPEELSLIGFLGRTANGDRIRPEQTPRGRQKLEPPTKLSPDQRLRLAKRLRERANRQPGLSADQRKELRRHASNAEKQSKPRPT